MQSVRTKFSVGLFVILGMTAVILIVLWLGMAQYFQEGHKYTAYFDESVQGLSQDAAVKYRGVNVGRVEQINVAPDGRLIEIVFTLDKTLRKTANLVAQIKSVGITGIMFVELERQAPDELVTVPDYKFEPKHPVVATRPSDIKQLLSDINEILGSIKQVDVEGISVQLSQLLEKSNQLLDTQKWSRLRSSAEESLQNINGLITDTRRAVNRIDAAVNTSAGRFDNAVNQVGKAAETADDLFARGSASLDGAEVRVRDYDRQMADIMEQLREAAANINSLINQLERQPSQILYGEPVPEKPVAPETR
ncbi:MAG: MlaD family protein [Desulfosalsimonas sp.]|uniref:MlaD family protein n=1 Tax=Desulfosalsimonas sp. TaxID=3073848 RepID=UPI003970E18E